MTARPEQGAGSASADTRPGPERGAGQQVRTRQVVAWACLALVAARLLFVTQPLRSDEGGYLLLARHWRSGGEFLYGDYHVDRPPLLMAIFRLAAVTEWDGAIRVLSIPFAVVTVLAVAHAARVLAGDRAARWAAVVAAALLASPALTADQADGELFAAPFVAGSVAVALVAWRRPGGSPRWWLAVGAGALAGAASLVKQNFLEGLLFVATLVLVDTLRRRTLTARSRVVGTGVLVGAVLPALAVLAWAHVAGVDGLRIWTDLAAFRGDAFGVIWQHSTRAPVTRAVNLVALAMLSMMLPLAWTWFRACVTSGAGRMTAEEWGVTVGLGYGLVAIAGGGSYWPHYLIGLVPFLALAAGLVAGRETPAGRSARRWSRVAAGSALVLVVVEAVVYATVPWVWYQQRTGEWLAASSEAGDTAWVAYGQPAILESADLSSPYPYLWSLPMRTLDPGQDRLRATLAGPEAPTWVVEANSLNSWQIDASGRLRGLLEARYDRVATVCGLPIWLRADLSRDLAPLPRC